MPILEMASERDLRSKAVFSEALALLLAEQGKSLQDISRTTGYDVAYLASLLDGHQDPSPAVVELVARSLSVAPDHFLEYRLAAVILALRREPDRVNQLFLESLSSLERESLDVATFDNRPFVEAVRATLSSEEMTQGELAESIGLSQSELSLVLNGRRNPPADLPEAIAQALGVPPEFFLAYRLAIVHEWLRERPETIDGLMESLERTVELAPYEAWPARALPDPQRVPLVELARSLAEIITVEAPVIGARVYAVRLRAAGIETETRELRSVLNRASYALMQAGAIVGVNERLERTQKYLVLRPLGAPEVRVRTRGDRRVTEIPLSEVRAVVEATRAHRYGESVAAIQEEVLGLYDVSSPRLDDLEHINRALSQRRDT
jgi:transcriptional regulator with XRE-family HTH domain